MFRGYHWFHGSRGRLHFGCIFSPGLANNHFIGLLQGVRLRVIVGRDALDRVPPDRHLSSRISMTQVHWQRSSMSVLERRHIRVRVEFQVASKNVVCTSVFLLDAFYKREACLLRVEGHLVKSRHGVNQTCMLQLQS